MKHKDRPLWLDVYEAFPPHIEPKFDRPIPGDVVRNILYKEDIDRALVKSIDELREVHPDCTLDRLASKALALHNDSDGANQGADA